MRAFTEATGVLALSEADKADIRAAASLTIREEELQAKIVSGEPYDEDQAIRTMNSAVRARARIKCRPTTAPTPSEYWASRQKAVASP